MRPTWAAQQDPVLKPKQPKPRNSYLHIINYARYNFLDVHIVNSKGIYAKIKYLKNKYRFALSST